ncbi:hypothetical protein ANCCAN_24559 [Ancylostoma caninum]|uniref:Ectopic P granules protein 5 n=1 Tax=Ancylostoma caninum TaxID=29170 RepID=A0A368FFM5_ANCCA|nr:hypothetical protein ANCCAN_24559 [Ancylostoma caninum]
MEAVKPRKPKQKHRSPVREAPPAPSRPALVMGMRLPDAPQHEPCRASTPEPEEIEIIDDELPTTSTVPEDTPVAESSTAEPTQNGIAEESEKSAAIVEASSLPAQVAVFEPVNYPAIPQLSESAMNSTYTTSIAPPLYEVASKGYMEKEKPIIAEPQVADAPPLYPSLAKLHYEKDKHGLLTEQNLLAFYHNPMYMMSDEFVDKFVQNNLVSSGPLFPLLKRLKKLCEQMAISEVSEKENTENLSKCLRDCWVMQQQTFETKGKCGENKDASGTGRFHKVVLCTPKVEELKNLLAANRTHMLDERICQESQFRSTALQVQWIVISINQQFMQENSLSLQSPPTLLETAVPSNGRIQLLNALSDIFFHMRFPALPKRFTDALVGWARELVHTLTYSDGWPHYKGDRAITGAPTPPKVKVDYCITMLSHLMNPIAARETFLRQIGLSETEDSTWAILSEDDEEGDFSFVTINESDLTCLLDQLPVSELYSLAYLYFSSTTADKGDQFVALVAFQLMLMKVLDTGLSTYSTPAYKQFSKQIGNSLRQSVRELCSHWVITRNLLPRGEDSQLQSEVDRIVLLALQYITNRSGFGLWQFLVDLPYDCVSEDCRSRCEYFLRSSEKITVSEVYDIPISEIIARNRLGGLKERAEAIGPLDSVFLINTLASILSYSHNDAAVFIKEIIEVCFCDESSRESLYKVGGEAVSLLLARRPSTFDQLLTVLDRSMAHMDNYAVNVLASSNMSGCKLSPATLSVIGKWLINKPPDDVANRVARRVLSSLHWGPNETGDALWLDPAVHEITADTVMKAHSTHCGHSNGMISKSIRQISKLASRMADHEQLFNQFCWDILIKMKLSSKESTSTPQNDLSAFFIHVDQSCLGSVAVFVDRGVPLMNDLVAAGCSTACVVLLGRLMEKHYAKVSSLGSNSAFMELFERILHVDQCSYAVQWITGPSLKPTPIVRLICSSISYYSKHVHDVGEYLRAWVDILCVRRPAIWNNDNATLQVFGSIAHIAFLNDAKNLLGIPDIIYNTYQQMLVTWREGSKGLFSMFTAEQAPPPLIASTMFEVAPWATYLLLLVESKSYSTFYQFLHEAFVKKDKTTVEQAVKKAASKSSLALPLARLAVYRWAEFITVCSKSTVFPLAVQRLATEAYRLKSVNGRKYCFARRLLDAPQADAILSPCRKVLNEVDDPKGLAKAVSGWLFCSHEVTRMGFNFSVFDLDYLLQLILADDMNIWVDFIDNNKLVQEELQEEKLFLICLSVLPVRYQLMIVFFFKLYSVTCHLGRREPVHQVSEQFSSKPSASRAVGFPTLPAHPCLPSAPVVDMSALFQLNTVMEMVKPLIKHIHTLSEDYVIGGDNMASEDTKYAELLTKLHAPVSQQIPVQLRCGIRCTAPYNTAVQVTGTKFNETVDAEMAQSREKRNTLLGELHTGVLDRTAVASATMEHIARQVARLSILCSSTSRSGAQMTGRALFKTVTSSLSGSEMLFPAASSAYENTLRILAEEFVRMQPSEQIPVMVLVLEGFALSDPLIESFTPECLSSTELCSAYTRLSEAVRDPGRSASALKLLRRLGMDKAAASLPPQQFAPLLPLAFRNLASQPDSNAPLHILCLEHVVTFVFHAFPANFIAGLDLALNGCNTGETPPSLLETFVERLGADHYEMPKGENVLNGMKAEECAMLLARRLSEARSRSPSMYSAWGRYLGSITMLAQLFLFTPTRESFPAEAPSSVLQRDLAEVFQRVVSVFSPLIVPVSASMPPFSPSNEPEADVVLDGFIHLLTSLPHNAVLQPGTQNIPSLLWQFYYEKLSILSHGSTHYFAVLERHFVRIPWPSFYPSERGLTAMDECLATRSPCCAPFIAQIVVRIMWKDVLTSHIASELLPYYLSVLFSVLLRIGSNQSNYVKVRASLLDLVKALCQRSDWSAISPERAEEIAKVVAVCLPFDSLSNPTDVVAVLQIIWRKMCCFVVREPFTSAALLKQTAWIRTECALVLRGGATAAPPAYNSLIADVDAVAQQHENLRAFSIAARELTALWCRISDAKFGEALVTTWNAYIDANPESPLVLTSLNTLIGSLNVDQLTTALKCVEKTIRAYFKRNSFSWNELMQWAQCPNNLTTNVRDYLLSVSSSNKAYPLMLTTAWFLKFVPPSDAVFSSLHAFVTSIKPKHVWCEASFLLLIWQEVRWLADAVLAAHANPGQTLDDRLPSFMRWLSKAAKDDSSFITNLITSKKTAHSPRLRSILTILELYLTQQMMGESQLPRASENSPVLNSRIHALKEAAATKANQQFAAAFNIATPFFVQVDMHHIGSAPSLILQCSRALFKEKFLLDLY